MKQSEATDRLAEAQHWSSSVCRFCGVAERWPYGTAREIKSCRQCYQADDFGEMYQYVASFSDRLNSIKNRRLRDLEYARIKRQFYRIKRRNKFILEPEVKCEHCKRTLPVFEFPMVSPQYCPAICYECDSLLKDTQTCPKCKQRLEHDEFEDDQHTYTYCRTCRIEIKRKRDQWDRIHNIIHLRVVTNASCHQALSVRGIEENEETIGFIRELLLAKRIASHLKSIKQGG